ncbi:tpr repeat-containing protein [Plasmopara halstedii]|uniref:Tpr repeat-containing protein n=1 Tax=Plasmopara halstedii TaxID=4781 RepID=A0A0P1AHQ2_PLAHL|nr:tpr repeat-containing protein [Plasmopara halstedii]CEG40236.1 tpr repeat-containing protein [Plasmopara halstedii]|eukprot:XP_024576605.1 tpr repeat-containing protein [Plasmopara halstedii]
MKSVVYLHSAARWTYRQHETLNRHASAALVDQRLQRNFSSFRFMDTLYEGQDFARQVEKKFSELSGKTPWEPDVKYLKGIKSQWQGPEPTLNELVREDVPTARNLFRNVLQRHYPKDMGMWNKWGVMEWKAGNHELARMIFSKASKISYHTELWTSWGSMELEVNNSQEAKRIFKVILATDPQNPMAGLGMALWEAQAGHPDKAREKFEDLLRHHPRDVLIMQAFAVFEAQCQHIGLARKIFQSAVSNPRATGQVWHAWAKAEYDAGFYKNALAVITSAFERFPTHKWLILLGALAHYKLGDVYEARRAYRRLIDGGLYVEPAAYNSYAKMEEELGNEDVAVRLYQTALEQHPDHVPSMMSLAILYQKRGQMHYARKLFEKALESLQHTGPILQAFGSFEEQHGKLGNARELYEEATKVQPTAVESWRALARVEAKLENYEAARSAVTMASQHVPNDVPLLIELAKIEQRNRRIPAARSALEKALMVDSSDASIWNMRALLELPLNPDRAKTIVENALSIVPEHEKTSWSILMCTYGRIYAALGDLQQAVAAFQRSFQLRPKNWETHFIYADSVLMPNEVWSEAVKHLTAACKLLSRTDRRRVKVERKLCAAKAMTKAQSNQHDDEHNNKDYSEN